MIENENELQALCRHAIENGSVALDTEFIWERTFFPRLGVVQFGFADEAVYLVDALALPALPGLGDVLENAGTQLLLHDAQQDLQILSRHTGRTPCHVFDTRRAAGFAGLHSTISLAELLQSILDVHLPKGATRSNWLQRPLSGEQITYALDDVRHMHALRDTLLMQAEQLGNTKALCEEMRIYNDPSLYEDAPFAVIYNRFKPFRWNHRQRALLYSLVTWRETEARQRDKPRGHILHDKDLSCIAQQCPRTEADLDSLSGLSHALKASRRHTIMQAVAAAEQLTPEALPPPPTAHRLSAAQKKRIRARQTAIAEAAAKASIDPALVANKAQITAITLYEDGIGAKPPERLLTGWRQRFTMAGNNTSAPACQRELPL